MPFCPLIDHSEHLVKVLVTEHGLADRTGLGPAERARRIIRHCPHPAYSHYPNEHVRRAPPGHTRHDLAWCFELHRTLLEPRSMLPGLRPELCLKTNSSCQLNSHKLAKYPKQLEYP